MTIGIAGAGHMGGAILRALAAGDVFRPLRILVCDAASGRAEALAGQAGPSVSPMPSAEALAAAAPDVILLAVRPADLAGVCAQISAGLVAPARRPSSGVAPDHRPAPLFLSIAAGRTTAWIEERLPSGSRVVRAMPNLGVTVGLGASAYAPGNHATERDLALAGKILASFGLAVRLDESQLNAVTALSGSGPAFFAWVLRALADAGVALGLDRGASEALAMQTFLGTATVLSRPGAPSPTQFIDAVATPGGTTAAGKAVLDASDAAAVLAATLKAASDRAAELAASDCTSSIPPANG